MLRETGELPPSADVIVLGAGVAGHCAALAAAEQGASVMLLEKASQPGGSSAMAGGGFIFSGTDLMREAGHEDDIEALRAAIFESGKGRNNPELVDVFVNRQLEAYEFLKRRHRARAVARIRHASYLARRIADREVGVAYDESRAQRMHVVVKRAANLEARFIEPIHLDVD